MRRRYLRELYEDRVSKIKNIIPDSCIGVDVIVGFPGETEEDFLDTYNFLNELNISYLHVFTYSERPNTPAAAFDEVVPDAIRAKRSKMLRGLSAKKRQQFYQSQLETQQKVLWEGENKQGYMHGFTANYVKMRQPWDPHQVNKVQDVHLRYVDEEGFVRS